MTEHMFGITKRRLSARDAKRRDTICKREGGYGYTQYDQSMRGQGDWLGWFSGPDNGRPFTDALARRVLAAVAAVEEGNHE